MLQIYQYYYTFREYYKERRINILTIKTKRDKEGKERSKRKILIINFSISKSCSEMLLKSCRYFARTSVTSLVSVIFSL